MNEFDWLDDEPEKKKKAEALPVLVPKGVSPVEIPADSEKRNAKVRRVWNKLSRNQQTFLDSLRKHNFNVSATARALANTSQAIHRVTANRWAREDEDYAFVLKVMKAIARDEVIDRDRLLLRADEIAEKALEPVPILYQGQPTGFFEHDLRTALSANEQLMKTQKMLGNDQEQQFQQGPALIIQVVQPRGEVIDVTPGVKVDLPVPDGT